MGAELLGVDLPQHIQLIIDALKLKPDPNLETGLVSLGLPR
jgi:hypothetical protein